eukprot:Em0008g160a
MFDELSDRNQAALNALLEGDLDSDVPVTMKLRGLYQECMNINAIEALGAAPLLNVIKATGGANLLNGSGQSIFDINDDTFFNQRLYGSGAFFSLYVSVDDTNSSRYILTLSQSGLTFPTSEYYHDNGTYTVILKYYIHKIFKLLNSSIDSSIYENAAEEIVNLEEQLAKIFVPNDKLILSNTYNPYKLGDLSLHWPYYNWTRNIKKLLHEAGVNITDSETIIVKTPTYFTKLATLLNTINSSTTENYALWQLIHPYIRFIEVSFADAYYNFSQTVQGSGRPQRYETCISYVQSVMPMALARIYALKILPNGTKINTSSYFASYVSYVTSSTLATFANLPKTVDKTIYFKYGAIGLIIGHELTHGFDNTGQQYNKDGIFTPWWTNKSIQNFVARQRCFEAQYSQYEIFGYHAYKDVSGNTSPLLPNVNYNQDQLYFIAFGQLWCSLLTPSYIQSSTKSDAHSPGPVRVIGVVQNSAEFANAFNCKAGAPMNPSNKCTLW